MARRPHLTPELRAEKRMDYQRCHALGHRWDPIPVTRPPSFGVAIDLRCENCGTVRRDIVSRLSGQRLTQPIYDYPEGYHDYERHDKAWWRAAWYASLYEVARELINTERENAVTGEVRPRRYATDEQLTSPRRQRGSRRPTQPAQRVRKRDGDG